jgi:DNA-binding TFAR19-related protein (PDSD5 family)
VIEEAIVNLNRQGQIFENINDEEIGNIILQQIHYTITTQTSRKYGKH